MSFSKLPIDPAVRQIEMEIGDDPFLKIYHKTTGNIRSKIWDQVDWIVYDRLSYMEGQVAILHHAGRDIKEATVRPDRRRRSDE